MRTVANLLPLAGGLAVYWILLFGPLIFVVLSVLLRFLPLGSLLVALPTPLLVKAYRTINYFPIFHAHLVFGVVYSLSLLLKPVFL